MDEEVNITYETLFDILRVEKGREDIQQLTESFFADVVSYLRQKKAILENKEHESGIDSFDEVKKMRIQYENIQRLIKEIYERREKKIIMMSLNASRTKMGMDTAHLLPEERALYLEMKNNLDSFRTDVMHALLNAQTPTKSMPQAPVTPPTPEPVQEPAQLAHIPESPMQEPTSVSTPEPTPESTMEVRFLAAVEPFVGPELETYGPFQPDATATMPAEIATILINKGHAEALKNS